MTLHPDLLHLSPADLQRLTPEQVAQLANGPQGGGLRGTLASRLGIEFLSVAQGRVVARMPVEGNRQPMGRLHGGANLALAEEVASFGSWLNIDLTRQGVVGVDVNATHIRGVEDGFVTAEATLAYRGRSVLVWTIEIRDERGRVISLARCTCNVISMGA